MNGVGFGIEKLPDLNFRALVLRQLLVLPEHQRHVFGSDSQHLAGVQHVQVPGRRGLRRRRSPIFIDLGWMGDNLTNKTNAPATSTPTGHSWSRRQVLSRGLDGPAAAGPGNLPGPVLLFRLRERGLHGIVSRNS